MTMKKRSKPVFNGAEIVTALVYLCAISAVMMYLLCRDYVVICTVIMTALCTGVYMLFYTFRNRRLVSFVIFASMFVMVLMISAAVRAVSGSMAIFEFIYNASDHFSLLPAVSCILMFSFVVTYPVFYFTVRIPRPFFLLLPALAPLILAARTLGRLPAGLTAFLATGYFVAVMGVSRVEYPSDNIYIDDRASRKERLAAFGLFGVIAAALLMIIPRSDETKYSKYLDAAWLNKAFYGIQSSGFSQSSVPNTGNNNPPDNLLFYVTTKTPRNIINQSFDIYNGKKGWTYLREYSRGTSNWRTEQRRLNYNALAYDLKKGTASGKLSNYADALAALPDIPLESLYASTMMIQMMDRSNTTVVRHPAGTYNARISNSTETIYRNPNDEMFTRNPFGTNASYTLTFFGEPTDPEFARYLSGLSGSEYLALLDAAADEEVIDETTADAFKNAYTQAMEYGSDTIDAAITPRIKELADSITEGLTNDYDKVIAIENWFGRGGFVYDLNFVPQELTAEYFLFTSKRGICTDFATASVLLIRAAGIPARYTEGYLIKTDIASKDVYGRYEIKADQAHAFATAYIAGVGWVEIDGTKTAAMANSAKYLQLLVFYLVSAAVVIAILCVIFRKRISEAAFAVHYKLCGKTKKIRLLYIRTRKTACGITGAKPASATSGEVRDIISRTLSLGKEAGEITDAADALLYGDGSVQADTKRLYRNYKRILKARRMRGKS